MNLSGQAMNEADPSCFEVIKFLVELSLAGFTGLLALFTWNLASETQKLAEDSQDSSFRQIGVQTWLAFRERFDSHEMREERTKLASRMRSYRPEIHKTIAEAVPNFF